MSDKLKQPDNQPRERVTEKSKQVGGTIKKSIGEHYSNYIEELIASGRYLTVAEVLREALRLHEKQSA